MKQLLCCSDSDTGSFHGFLQLPIRPNSIFPIVSSLWDNGVGVVCMYVFMHTCMYYVCINACISVYVCIMHNTYICVYVCMYTIQIKFITRATLHRNVNLRRGIIHTLCR